MNKHDEIQGITWIKKLGEGTQGEVWHIRKNETDFALKLYHESTSTQEQRIIIHNLVEAGLPSPRCADHFTWPLEYIETVDKKRFGYLMQLIDTGRYISFGKVEAGVAKHPGFGVMIEVCRQLADYFREIHIAGLCYQDMSKNNFMFLTASGEVMICDTDNIVVNGSGLGSVQGTPSYIAPEIVRGEAKPSTDTDHHSLSVILFILMCGNNPFHGEKEANIKIMDGVASEYLYGHPVFVFDPADKSNRLPDAPGYRHVAKNWNILPTYIRELFQRAFTKGLHDPAQRVTAVEWIAAFAQLQGLRQVCTCGAENFWDPARQDRQLVCWNRNCSVDFPPKLHVRGNTNSSLLVKPGQFLTTMHLGEKSTSTVVGEMEKHPSDSSLVLLRNKTATAWQAMLGNQQIEIPEGRAIPLHPGLTIKAARNEFTVYP